MSNPDSDSHHAHLPYELISQIISHLSAATTTTTTTTPSTQSTLSKCARLNRLWNSCAVTALYRDIELVVDIGSGDPTSDVAETNREIKRVEKIVQSLAGNPNIAVAVKSLVYSISTNSPVPQEEDLQATLSKVHTLLTTLSLPNLQALSLTNPPPLLATHLLSTHLHHLHHLSLKTPFIHEIHLPGTAAALQSLKLDLTQPMRAALGGLMPPHPLPRAQAAEKLKTALHRAQEAALLDRQTTSKLREFLSSLKNLAALHLEGVRDVELLFSNQAWPHLTTLELGEMDLRGRGGGGAGGGKDDLVLAVNAFLPLHPGLETLVLTGIPDETGVPLSIPPATAQGLKELALHLGSEFPDDLYPFLASFTGLKRLRLSVNQWGCEILHSEVISVIESLASSSGLEELLIPGPTHLPITGPLVGLSAREAAFERSLSSFFATLKRCCPSLKRFNVLQPGSWPEAGEAAWNHGMDERWVVTIATWEFGPTGRGVDERRAARAIFEGGSWVWSGLG